MRIILANIVALMLASAAGCAVYGEPDRAARVEPARLGAARLEEGKMVPVFESGDGASAPAVKMKLGLVSTHSCRHAFDTSAAKSEIKDNLRMQAMALGANGVLDVSYSPFTYNHKSPCRMGLSGEGMAVLFILPRN